MLVSLPSSPGSRCVSSRRGAGRRSTGPSATAPAWGGKGEGWEGPGAAHQHRLRKGSCREEEASSEGPSQVSLAGRKK